MITVRVDSTEVNQALGSLAQNANNLRPAFNQIGEYILRQTQLRFDKQQDPDKKSWQPLKPSTLRKKQQKSKILKILQQDGDLRRSIVYQATDKKVEIGTNRIYGAIHQFGGNAGRGRKTKIPARPYLGVNGDDEREVVAIIEDYLQG